MSGADTRAFYVKQKIMELPGKRGIDIPEDKWDRIFHAANGITQGMWGRPPTPHQLQWLHDNGHHEPAQIHEAYSNLPHPHAPSLTVGEYQQWKQATQLYRRHQ